MTSAVFPGTFDPMTLGHMDLLRRATGLFDSVIVAVAESKEKHTLLSHQERIELTRELTSGMKGVRVEGFSGLLRDFVLNHGARVVIRGVRSIEDFSDECQMAGMNRVLMPEVETLFMMSDPRYQFIKSSLVREIVKMGGSVSAFIAPAASKALAAKIRYANPMM